MEYIQALYQTSLQSSYQEPIWVLGAQANELLRILRTGHKNCCAVCAQARTTAAHFGHKPGQLLRVLCTGHKSCCTSGAQASRSVEKHQSLLYCLKMVE